jgi:hypothetical protein
MSWLFSQVLVAEYLGDISSDGEPFVPLSGNNTQLAYLPPDKMTDFSRLSRFGMMFKPLTESLGEELLMSYRADFHAKTSPLQEKEQELMVTDQECGRTWQGLLAKYDPNTHTLRTAQCSLLEDLNECLQTWPNLGSMRNGECWEQGMWVLNTSEIEYGLLPDNENFFHTPTTGTSGGSNSRKALAKRQEKPVMWPTPTTPSGGGNAGGSGATRTAKANGTYITSSINPNLYEWLMGWPQGWTDLKPLEMDKYHKWLELHGNC